MNNITHPLVDKNRIEGIQAEADLHIRTVEYLRNFPEDIKTETERLWLQRQYLLDTIYRLTCNNE